jgi:queuosine precursor transporter
VKSKAVAVALILAFVGSVLAANWAVATFGLVSIGFGLVAPAGTYFAGVALALRDGVQESAGVWWAAAAIVVGSALSYVVAGPALAVASAAAFLLSEMLDLAVYTPLRQWSWVVAVIASGVLGAAVDTWAFLTLAGFPVSGGTFAAQLVAKAVYVMPVGLVLVWAVRRWSDRRAVARCAA